MIPRLDFAAPCLEWIQLQMLHTCGVVGCIAIKSILNYGTWQQRLIRQVIPVWVRFCSQWWYKHRKHEHCYFLRITSWPGAMMIRRRYVRVGCWNIQDLKRKRVKRFYVKLDPGAAEVCRYCRGKLENAHKSWHAREKREVHGTTRMWSPAHLKMRCHEGRKNEFISRGSKWIGRRTIERKRCKIWKGSSNVAIRSFY